MQSNRRSYRRALQVSLIILSAGVLSCVFLKDWIGMVVTGTFWTSTALLMRVKPHRLPYLFSAMFALSALLNTAGYIWDMYVRVPHFDDFAHALTSFSVALTFGYLFYAPLHRNTTQHRTQLVIAVVCTTLTVGVLWEFFELLVGILGSLEDTLLDLAMDGLGASAGSYFVDRALRPKTKTFVIGLKPALRADALAPDHMSCGKLPRSERK